MEGISASYPLESPGTGNSSPKLQASDANEWFLYALFKKPFRGYNAFEGEFKFISTVMEYPDGLYAAASSLGIDLQIFLSYSPELTNEVIVSCIKSATKLTRGLYPKWTKLHEFLEFSHDQRMHVLENYHVPEESISLFSVFCRYGEREDSKSIMTDCSSVSSGPESDRCRLYQVENERKRKNPFSSR